MPRDDLKSQRSYVIDLEDLELDYCPECDELIVPGHICPCGEGSDDVSRRPLRPAA